MGAIASMRLLLRKIRNLLIRQEGPSTVEYALMLALIIAVVIVAVLTLR